MQESVCCKQEASPVKFAAPKGRCNVRSNPFLHIKHIRVRYSVCQVLHLYASLAMLIPYSAPMVTLSHHMRPGSRVSRRPWNGYRSWTRLLAEHNSTLRTALARKMSRTGSGVYAILLRDKLLMPARLHLRPCIPDVHKIAAGDGSATRHSRDSCSMTTLENLYTAMKARGDGSIRHA